MSTVTHHQIDGLGLLASSDNVTHTMLISNWIIKVCVTKDDGINEHAHNKLCIY
jgi:hypothetical protein